MKFIDRHKQVTSGTSAAVITLGAVEFGARTLAQAIAASEISANEVSSFCMEDDLGNYEEFLATVNSGTQITRTAILRSSNNNAAVTFAGTKRVVYNTPTASFFSKLIGTDAAATTTVANTATSTLVLIEGGVAKTITLDNFLTAIGQNPTSLPATSTFDDADRLLVFKADGSARTILGSIVKASGAPAPADTTAPTLTSASGTQTGTTTANGSVSTNEANGTLYYLFSTASSATATAVKAGSNKAVTVTGAQSVSTTGLTSSTAYYVHFLHRDAAGNDSTVLTSAQFTTAAVADATAPTLSSPTGTQTGATTASGTVSTNEANGTLYRYTSANASETAATVKAANLTQSVTATGVQNVTFTGLTALTQYYAHYVHRDVSGNDSAVASSAAFTTASSVDNTAPTLSSPSAASTGATTGSGSVTTNEGNGTLYYRATQGTSETGTTVKDGSTLAITSTGSKAVTVSGLAASTDYYLHFLHRDAAGNDSAVVTSAKFTTAAAGDTTAPTLSSPTGTQTGATTASGSVSTNEANGTLYRFISANATETAATVKAANLTQTVTATGAQNVSATGLTASSPYYWHFVHRDAAGNDSAVASSAQFTTAAAAAPMYQFLGAAFPPFQTTMSFGAGLDYAGHSGDLKIKTPGGVGPIDADVDLYATLSTYSTKAAAEAAGYPIPRVTDPEHNNNAGTYKKIDRIAAGNAAYDGHYTWSSLYTYKSFGGGLANRYLWVMIFAKGADPKTATPIWYGVFDGNNTGTPVAITATQA